jgi:hypothetical protein
LLYGIEPPAPAVSADDSAAMPSLPAIEQSTPAAKRASKWT